MGWCDFRNGAARLRKESLLALEGISRSILPRLYYPARLHVEDATEALARSKLLMMMGNVAYLHPTQRE